MYKKVEELSTFYTRTFIPTLIHYPSKGWIVTLFLFKPGSINKYKKNNLMY
jgi:hypothetical protein